ncbi:MAG: LITAF-like zinc ribbon domain-containing protein [Candidatus Hermodarchaeota archaeon]
MVKTGKTTVYCPTCEQEVVLRRKNFDHIYHEVLCFLVILTAGIGFFVYLILKYSKKKDRCPNCDTQFNLQSLPDNKIIEKDNTN